MLQSAGIIDKDLNWKFGKGHLVILGDIFDRGDKVTEILWHLYGLEKQAERAGGMVHILLGNHELMVFERDLRYLSDKYKKVEAITGFCYSELFSVNSVLGGWLRSKPVLISINDIMFLHAGISLDLSLKYLEFSRINGIILKSLSGNGPVQVIDSTELDNITNSQGPVWYRGYFTDNKFTEDRLDSILNCFGKRHIIVGHTPNEHVHSYYGNKLFGIDSGLGHGEPGEMLLIKGDDFYIVDRTGKRSRLINGR